MRFFDAEAIRALAPMQRLIPCLEEAFRQDWVVPARQVIPVPGKSSGRLFLAMPAFDAHGAGAVKLVTIFPDNLERGMPTIQGVMVVFSVSGLPEAILDGGMVTRLRTGAASALASKYLSRTDSAHLVILGTGALAPYMALAHCTVRPIRRVSLWGRRRERAELTVAAVRALVPGVVVEAVDELEQVVQVADVVCCATRSSTPILQGRWLKDGAFVDLVGSFTPSDREADDEVIQRARIFVDTREGALAEAGDLLDPLGRGVIGLEKIEGGLADLARGRVQGRRRDNEITLFKSVGTAIEDLATAQMIVAA